MPPAEDPVPDVVAERGRLGPRIGVLAGAVFAVAAVVALFVTNNPKWLRLAVLLAVWALVISLVVLTRRPARSTADRSRAEVELRRTYELERERDSAALRERELAVEVRLRREIEDSLRGDLGGLRAEIAGLRQELAERWQGELRWERIALRAEATRLTGGELHGVTDELRRLETGRAAFGPDRSAVIEPDRPAVIEPDPMEPDLLAQPVRAEPARIGPAPTEPAPTPPRPAAPAPAQPLDAEPAAVGAHAAPPGRHRARHARDDDETETPADRSPPRRHRYRDDESEDTLARILGHG